MNFRLPADSHMAVNQVRCSCNQQTSARRISSDIFIIAKCFQWWNADWRADLGGDSCAPIARHEGQNPSKAPSAPQDHEKHMANPPHTKEKNLCLQTKTGNSTATLYTKCPTKTAPAPSGHTPPTPVTVTLYCTSKHRPRINQVAEPHRARILHLGVDASCRRLTL